MEQNARARSFFARERARGVKGSLMYVGSPEGYTTIEQAPGADAGTIREIAELMIGVTNSKDEIDLTVDHDRVTSSDCEI